MADSLIRRLFLLSLLFPYAFTADASIFGDGISDNGVEDERQSYRQAQYWAPEFNAVGKLSCQGSLRGSAILLSLENKNEPVILTAAHVTHTETLSSCHFALGATPHRTHKLSRELMTGYEQGQSLPMAYERDWVLIQLEHWPQWQRHALVHRQIEQQPLLNTNDQATYYFIGFDLVQNSILIHADCRAGSASDSSLIAGYESLIWDNCDSTGGASGGGLFIQQGREVKLLAFRVGSLFDQAKHRHPPEVGEPFELNTHINVSRLLSDMLAL